MQVSLQGQILTPLQMYEWVTKNVKGLHFVYAAKEDVELHHFNLVGRFESIQTVPGTRSHHRFVAPTANKIKMSRLSGDDCGTSVNASPEPEVEVITGSSINEFHPGLFVAVVYDNDWYIGCIIERSDVHQENLVKFMSKPRPNSITSLRHDETCWVPITNVLCFLSPPIMYGSNAIQYRYDEADFINCAELFQSRTVCK